MSDKYESLSGDFLALRLANAELRMELIAAGKWPPPPGWALTLEDLDHKAGEPSSEGIAERLTAALASR